MRLRFGQVAILLAAMLTLGACAGPAPTTETAAPPGPEDAPRLVMPRVHHVTMRRRAEEYCAPFGGEPVLVDWRYRSTFGKRGEWLMQTIWECREAEE